MRSIIRTALVAGLVAAIAAASLAIGATGQSGGKSTSAKDRGAAMHRVLGRGYLADVADKLGVSTSKLQTALRNADQGLGRPKPPSGTDRNEIDKQREQRCTAVTDAVAKELGTDGDSVRSAFKSVAKERIEKAVDDGKLSASQAKQMESRIDSSSCFLPPPPGGGPGCDGHGGPPPTGNDAPAS